MRTQHLSSLIAAAVVAIATIGSGCTPVGTRTGIDRARMARTRLVIGHVDVPPVISREERAREITAEIQAEQAERDRRRNKRRRGWLSGLTFTLPSNFLSGLCHGLSFCR